MQSGIDFNNFSVTRRIYEMIVWLLAIITILRLLLFGFKVRAQNFNIDFPFNNLFGQDEILYCKSTINETFVKTYLHDFSRDNPVQLPIGLASENNNKMKFLILLKMEYFSSKVSANELLSRSADKFSPRIMTLKQDNLITGIPAKGMNTNLMPINKVEVSKSGSLRRWKLNKSLFVLSGASFFTPYTRISSGLKQYKGNPEDRKILLPAFYVQPEKKVWLASESWPVSGFSQASNLKFICGFRVASRRIATEYAYFFRKGFLDNYFIIGIPFIDLVLRIDTIRKSGIKILQD